VSEVEAANRNNQEAVGRKEKDKMRELTVHCIMVYRNKRNPNKYMSTSHTLTGKLTSADLSGRIDTLFTAEASSWSNEWELVTFSHAFLP